MKVYQFGKSYSKGLSLDAGTIYQIEELSLLSGTTMPEHVQLCDEITYVISGKAKMYSGDTVEDICTGQIHFIQKGYMHKIEVDTNEDFRYICIGYTIDNSALRESVHAFFKRQAHCILSDDATVRRLSTLMVKELYAWDEDSTAMLSHYLTQILIAVYRLGNGNASVRQSGDGMKAGRTVYRTLRYIDQEFIQIESVKEISESLSYSEYYLSHLFKEKTGTTIKEYITHKKITYACELLKTSPWSIEEIAEHLHFASAHAFRRAFKSVTGLTPREYKTN